MKKVLLAAVSLVLSAGVFAVDLNRPGAVSLSVDVLGLFQNELTVHAEYRFAAAYSGELGVTYGFGGRAAHPDGSFIDFVPAVKSFPMAPDSTHANWYLKLLGKTRFLFLSGEFGYGAGAGFGYDRVFASFLLNPEVTSEVIFGKDLTLALRLAAGFTN